MQSVQLSSDSIKMAGLERLRQSQQLTATRDHEHGFALGKAWALQTAESEQLKRVAALNDVDHDVSARDLTAAIEDDGQPSWDQAAGCMESVLDAVNPTAEEIAGFIEGAAEIYSEV